MDFLSFCRGHGILIDELPQLGRWCRYKTEDKPHKKNGAVIFEGTSGAVQNWARHAKPERWTPEGGDVRPLTDAERAAAARRRAEREDTQEKQWARAAQRAQSLIDTCRPGHHGYSMLKGFANESVLVTPDAAMVVPMRSLRRELMGAQSIRWLADERRWEKLFLAGARAKGAVFEFGYGSGKEVILCEGWATGRSLIEAVASLHLGMTVLACFSAGNVSTVAGMLTGRRVFVFADHDAPERDPAKWVKNPGEAGQRLAAATGLPWAMSDREGEDANDVHQRQGLRPLAAKILELRRMRTPPAWKPAPPPEGVLP